MDVERGTENEELENAYLSIRGYDQSEETAGSRLLLRSRARKMAPAPEPEKAEWEDEGSLMNAIRPTINVPMIFAREAVTGTREFVQGLADITDFIAEKTGLPKGGVFDQFLEVTKNDAAYWDDMIKNEGWSDRFVGTLLGRTIPGLTEFALNAPYAGLRGYAETGSALHGGGEALRRYAVGKILHFANALGIRSRIGAMSALGGGEAFIQGARGKDLIDPAATMGAYGFMGGIKGRNPGPMFPWIGKVGQAFKAETSRPSLAAASGGERGSPLNMASTVEPSRIQDPSLKRSGTKPSGPSDTLKISPSKEKNAGKSKDIESPPETTIDRRDGYVNPDTVSQGFYGTVQEGIRNAEKSQPVFEKDLAEIAKDIDAEASVRIKTPESAVRKIQNRRNMGEPGYNAENVPDYLAGRIIDDPLSNIGKVQTALKAKGHTLLNVQDHMSRPKATGEVGQVLTVRLADGHIAEVEIVPREIMNAKARADLIRETWKAHESAGVIPVDMVEAYTHDIERARGMFAEGFKQYYDRIEARKAEGKDAVGGKAPTDAQGIADALGIRFDGVGMGQATFTVGQDTFTVPEAKLSLKAVQKAMPTGDRLTKGKTVEGTRTTIQTLGGELPARYELVDIDSIRASHDARRQFAKTKGYPEQIQERDYLNDQAEQLKVLNHAASHDARFVISDNPDAVNGPPVVSLDGNVLGGNSRVMSLQVVFDRYPRLAEAYRAQLKADAARYGVEVPDGPVRSILVRRLTQKVNEPKIVRNLNENFTQGIKALRLGVSKGKLVSQSTMDRLGEELDDFASIREYLRSPASRWIINAMARDGAIERTDVNRLSNKTGLLNEDGKVLFEAIIRGKVIDDYDLIEAGQAQAPGAMDKIDKALPFLAAVKARGGEWDATPLLKDALDTMIKYRVSGYGDLGEFLAQQGLFGEATGPKRAQVAALTHALLTTKPLEFKARWQDFAKTAALDVPNQESFGFHEIETAAQAFERLWLSEGAEVAQQMKMWDTKAKAFELTPVELSKEERLAMAEKEAGKIKAVVPEGKIPAATSGKQQSLLGVKKGENYDLFSPKRSYEKNVGAAPSHFSESASDFVPNDFIDLEWSDGLFHVTTARDAVLRDGLKSGKQAGRVGLGGPAPGKVSVTFNDYHAQLIAERMRVAIRAAKGKVSVEEVLDHFESWYGGNFEAELIAEYLGHPKGTRAEWDDLLPWLEKEYKGRQFELVKDLENWVQAEQQSGYGGELDGYDIVGFLGSREQMSKLDPDQVDIVQVAGRKGSRPEHESGEYELRFNPDDVWVTGLAETSKKAWAKDQQTIFDYLDRQDPIVSTGNVLKSDPSGVRTLANKVSAEFKQKSGLDLVGHTVRFAEDLAALAQSLRNPLYETLRIFYVKGNRLVGHEAMTQRLPGSSRAFFGTDWAKHKTKMASRMSRMGAEGFYLLHNHPTGRTDPSGADLALTRVYAKELPGFKGHIIIDHNTYTVLHPEPQSPRGLSIHSMSVLPSARQGEKDPNLTPSIPHPVLEEQINGETDLVEIGYRMKTQDGFSPVFYLDADLKVRAVQELPHNLVRQPGPLEEWVRGQGKRFGSQRAVLYLKKDGLLRGNDMADLVKRAVFEDVITERPNAVQEQPNKGVYTIQPTSGIRGKGVTPKSGFTLGVDTTKGIASRVNATQRKYRALVDRVGRPLISVRDRQPGEIQARILESQTPEIPDKIINLNMNRIETFEQAKEVFAALAEVYGKELTAAKRNVVSHEETIKLADTMGMDPRGLIKMWGRMPLAHEALAARRLEVESAEMTFALARKAAALDATKVDKFNFLKAINQHAAIQEAMVGIKGEAARVVNSFKIPASAQGESLSRMIRDTLEVTGGEQPAEDLARKMLNMKHVAEVSTMARQAKKATVWDMFYEAWVNGLLYNPATHAVNLTGSAIGMGWQVPERWLAAEIGNVLGTEAGVQVGEARSFMYGMVEGAKDGFRLAARAWKSGDPSDPLTKLEVRKYRAITAENMGLAKTSTLGRFVDMLGTVIRGSGRSLMTGDEFMKAVAYRAELHGQAYRIAAAEGLSGDAMARRMRNIIDNPPEAVHLAAQEQQRYLTYTEKLGPAGQGVQKALYNTPAMRLIVPFLRTPVNLTKFVGQRTPLAPLGKQVRADLMSGGPKRDVALARMAIGSLAMAGIGQLVQMGIVTGGGPSDYETMQMWRSTGRMPYSIRIGDKWYSYGRTDPLGMLLGIGASTAEVIGQFDDLTAGEIASVTMNAVSKTLISKTYLQGLSDLFEVVSDPDRYGKRWVRRFTGSLIPFSAGVGAVERLMDPTMRDAQKYLDGIRERVPGWSTTLPARLNIWGEPIVLEGGWGPDIVSPFYQSTIKDNKAADEILAQEVRISMPARSVGNVELTPAEYHQYVKLSAGLGIEEQTGSKSLKHALISMMKDPFYQQQTGGPDGGKALMIRQKVQAFRAIAKEELLIQNAELASLVQKAREVRARNLTPQGE